MKCNLCESILEDISPHIDLFEADPGCRYINLRCHNLKCISRQKVETHLRILIPDAGPWTCAGYHFTMPHNNEWYLLGGGLKNNVTALRKIKDNDSEFIIIKFVSLPLDDGMSEQAKKLFDRIIELAVFA